MGSPIERVAQALLTMALGLTATGEDGRPIAVKGGRAGQGGPIPETPFVEVADIGWYMDPRPGSYGREFMRGRYAVVFYRAYGREVDREAEDLRELFWAFRDALRADYTLGGLVDWAHVEQARLDLIPREGKWYWAWTTLVEVSLEA